MLQFIPIVSKILDKVIPDKQENAKAKHRLAILQQSQDMERFNARFKAIMVEGASQDPWTSRARPSFLYVIYVYLLAGIPIGIVSVFSPESATQVATGMQAWFAAIPGEMWALFGAGYLGYTGAREFGKSKILDATKKADI